MVQEVFHVSKHGVIAFASLPAGGLSGLAAGGSAPGAAGESLPGAPGGLGGVWQGSRAQLRAGARKGEPNTPALELTNSWSGWSS